MIDVRNAGNIWLLTGCLLSLSASAQITSRAYQARPNTLYRKLVPLLTVTEVHQQSGLILPGVHEEEGDVSHLPHALWAGYTDFDLKRVAGLANNAPILMHCSVGVRSEKIGEKLLAVGYTTMHNLNGGLFEWVNHRYPVVGKTGRPTARLHAHSRVWGIWLRRSEKVYD